MTSRWTDFLAMAGNKPGVHCGDVTIVLAASVSGMKKITCPSGALTVAAEVGQVVGLTVELEGHGHLFLPWHNVLALFDAPEGA